jgi:hypothetical protein
MKTPSQQQQQQQQQDCSNTLHLLAWLLRCWQQPQRRQSLPSITP